MKNYHFTYWQNINKTIKYGRITKENTVKRQNKSKKYGRQEN